eukprot:SAG22_NODE_1531_length_4216_cov_3.079184_1_plen_1017_part_00
MDGVSRISTEAPPAAGAGPISAARSSPNIAAMLGSPQSRFRRSQSHTDIQKAADAAAAEAGGGKSGAEMGGAWAADKLTSARVAEFMDKYRAAGGPADAAQLLETEGFFEWALRSTVASVLSSLIVLSPHAPAVLAYNVWCTTLAVVCAKPTLGDAIKTWWFPLSGGAIGVPLTYLMLSGVHLLGLCGSIPASICAASVCFAVITFTLGDDIQARWALLPVVVGLVQPSYAGYVQEDDPAALNDAIFAQAAVSVLEVYIGYVAGGLCGVVALLLPFPRLATPQLRRRIVTAYEQIAELHVRLTVALLAPKVPHVLNEEMERLLGKSKLGQTMESIDLLFEEARWEPKSLWGSWGTRNHELQWHISAISVLVRNVNLRFHRKRINRTLYPKHAALAGQLTDDSKPGVFFFAMRQTLEGLQALSLATKREQLMKSDSNNYLTNLQDIIDDLGEDIDAGVKNGRYVNLLKELQACMARGEGEGEEEVDQRLAINLHESMWLTVEFSSKVLGMLGNISSSKEVPKWFVALQRESGGEALEDNAMRRMFPGAFISACNGGQLSKTSFVWSIVASGCGAAAVGAGPASSLQARLLSCFKASMVLMLSSAIGWLQGGPNLTEDVAIFCPICAVFVYESGLKTILPNTSRAWRWAVGTFIGSIWALWAMYVSGGDGVILGVAMAMLAFTSAYLQTFPLLGYAGLVASFSGPIVAVGFAWNGPAQDDETNYDQRAFARLSQSFNGCLISICVTMLVLPGLQRESISVRQHFLGSLDKLIIATQGMLHGLHKPVESADLASSLPPHLAMRKHVEELRHLVEQAAEEPVLSCGVDARGVFPAAFCRGLLGSIEQLYRTVVQLRALMRPLAKRGLTLQEALRTGNLAHGALLPDIAKLCGPALGVLQHTKKVLSQQQSTAVSKDLFLLISADEEYWEQVNEANNQLSKILQAQDGKDVSPTERIHPMQAVALIGVMGELHELSLGIIDLAWAAARIADHEHASARAIPGETQAGSGVDTNLFDMQVIT